MEEGHGLCRDKNPSLVQLMCLWRVGREAYLLYHGHFSPHSSLPERDKSAAVSAEKRKHDANDPKCRELGRVCIPIAVETHGNWGKVTYLVTYLAIHISCPNSRVLANTYGRLDI